MTSQAMLQESSRSSILCNMWSFCHKPTIFTDLFGASIKWLECHLQGDFWITEYAWQFQVAYSSSTSALHAKHVSFPARAWLDNYYSGSTRSEGQAALPSRSTDINPCDLFLRGWAKQKVIRSKPKHLTNCNNFEMILLLLNLTFIRSVMGLRFRGCRILCKMLRCMLICDTKWCSNLSNTDTAIYRRVFATILRTSEQENGVLLGTVGNCDFCCTKRPNYRRKTYF